MEWFIQCVIFLVLWKGFGRICAKQNTRGNQYSNYRKLNESGEQKRTSLEDENISTVQEEVTVDSHTAASGVLLELCLQRQGRSRLLWLSCSRGLALCTWKLPMQASIWVCSMFLLCTNVSCALLAGCSLSPCHNRVVMGRTKSFSPHTVLSVLNVEHLTLYTHSS